MLFRSSDKRTFPAIDITKSGTRKDELLVDKGTLAKMWVLRRILMQMGPVDAMEFLVDKLKHSKTNNEFFDIIISNPPYLDYSKKEEIDENVNFEPHIALFAPEDNPLHFYKQILVFANKNLNNGGQIYLEINPDFVKEFNSLLTEFKPNDVNFRVDFRGKKRLAKLSF